MRFPFPILLAAISTSNALPLFSTVIDWPGPQRIVDVAALEGGSYLALGMSSEDYGSPADLLLMKLDQQGDTLWTRLLGGSGREVPGGMEPTPDGGLLIAFTSYGSSPDSGTAVILRLDPSMDTLWCTELADEGPGGLSDVAFLPGGIAAAGFTGVPGATGGLAVLLNPTGDKLWTVSFNRSGPSYFASCSGSGSGPVFCGTLADTEYSGVWLLGTDWAGTVTMENRIATSPVSEGRAIVVTDAGLVVAGSTQGAFEGVADMMLAFTDGSGSTVWMETYGGDSWDRAGSLCPTGDGGWLLAGSSSSYSDGEVNRSEMLLVRTDPGGGQLWTRTHGTPRPDYCWGAAPCSDGGYALAGCVTDFSAGTEYDAWVLRVDSLGYLSGQGVSGHEPGMGTLPVELMGNPATDTVEFRVTLPGESEVEVLLFDMFGRLVSHPLFTGTLPAGVSDLVLDPSAGGPPQPSGVYLLQVRCGHLRTGMGLTLLGGGR